MTTIMRKHYSMKMDVVLEVFTAARAVADPVATVYLFVPERADTTDEPYFVTCASHTGRPKYDHKEFMAWHVPVFAGMSDRELRQYARDWVEDKLAQYMFGIYIDIEWDAQSLRERAVDIFVAELNALQKKHGICICDHPEGGLYLSLDNESGVVEPYPIAMDEENGGLWTARL